LVGKIGIRASVRRVDREVEPYALTRSASLSRPRQLVLALLSPALPVVLIGRMAGTARQRGRHFGKFLSSVPLIAALLMSWAAGEGAGYLAAAIRR
jgi:hypothetical protein